MRSYPGDDSSECDPFWSFGQRSRETYAPKGRANIVDSMSVRREVTPRINSSRVAATLMLGGCNQDNATARLANDLHPDKVEIIHAQFPCRSPEIHFFGCRFRFLMKTEMALGDICWDPLAKEWTWQVLPRVLLIAAQPSQIVGL
jgi:hypothetical protein